MRAEPHSTTGPRDRCGQIALGLASLGQRPRAAGGRLLQPSPLAFQPPLELAGTRDEKALQQVAVVQIECLVELRSSDRLIECDDIAAEVVDVEPNLFVTARDDYVAAERSPYHVKRLPQGRAGVLLVALGPEQREQRVTAERAPAAGGGGWCGEARGACAGGGAPPPASPRAA